MGRDSDDALAGLEVLLDTDQLRVAFLTMGIFLAAYEMLRDELIETLRDFYAVSYRMEGPKVDIKMGPAYAQEVLALDKNPVRASLLWFRKSGAVTDEDLEVFEGLRLMRNEIAHESWDRLNPKQTLRYAEAFGSIVGLLNKTSTWWVLNVEIPIDPQPERFATPDGSLPKVIPGRVLALEIMVQSLFNEPAAKELREEFDKAKRAMVPEKPA